MIYRVIFNEELSNQDLFVPTHIDFRHEEVEPYEGQYTIPDEQSEAFENHLNQSLIVSAWDIVEIQP